MSESKRIKRMKLPPFFFNPTAQATRPGSRHEEALSTPEPDPAPALSACTSTFAYAIPRSTKKNWAH
jgi:hypothetical protein